MNNVIIRKQKIKIYTSDEPLALRVRKQLNDALQYDLISMMEKVFAKTPTPDVYINIDKLKIDLGVIPVQDFDQNFIKLVETKLINELQKQVRENSQTIYANTEDKEDSSDGNRGTGSPESLQYISSRQQELNALLYFLQNGTYPWWYKEDHRKTPAELLDNLTEEETETFLIKILSVKKSYQEEGVRKIIERLFIHLPQPKNESIVYQLLTLYNSASITGNIKTLIENKEELLQLFSLSAKALYKRLFQFLISVDIENEENAIYKFIEQLKDEQKISIGELKAKINVAARSTAFDEELKQVFSKKREGITEAEKKVLEKKTPHIKSDEEGIYISNAGLVLLHPFLQSFFTEAELLNEGQQFISIAAQQKAAVLLYYLQCGNESYSEWEMAFNKIICGIASDEIIPADILITEKEKEESNALLQATVKYWEALKGASIEALQNTFILREGKVTWKDGYWLLQVERTGVDILLDRLPWGFSTIKFPWLESLIYTEW